MDLENRYGTLEIQKGLLVLLNVFDNFCLQNGIRYSLDSGSLLGAVRHSGFIPWDDDLDVMVDRDSYQKLRETIEDSNEMVCFTDLWFTRIRLRSPLYKSQPTLDIFILDNVPDSNLKRNIKIFQIAILQSLFKGKPTKIGSLATFLRLLFGYVLGKPFSYERKLKWFDKVAASLDGKPTKGVTSYYYLFRDLHIVYDSDVLEKVERHQFENIEANITAKYDQCLREMYGDYMTPPKEEDRNPEHLGERRILNF